MCVAVAHNMTLHFVDASNAFQTNVISDPSKRHYVGLPTLYLAWYKNRWPNHPLLLHHHKDLVMQTLRQIQGTKDAGNKWYGLLVKIFTKLGIKVNSTCRGVWHWDYDGIKSIICLTTDDILFGTTNDLAFQ